MSRLGFAGAGVALTLSIGPLHAQGPGAASHQDSIHQTVTIRLRGDTVTVIANGVNFIAPYQVHSGETFRNIAEKFYGSAQNAEMVAKRSGQMVDALPGIAESGTGKRYLLIESDHLGFVVPAPARSTIVQPIRTFLSSYPDTTRFEFQYDSVAMELGLTDEMKPFVKAFDLSRFIIEPPLGQPGPTLTIIFDKQPMLNLFAGAVKIRGATLQGAIASVSATRR